jgi:hypothetical protein
MAVLVAFTIGLMWWVVAWAFGIKAFDAFLLTVLITIGTFAATSVKPHVDRMLGKDAASTEDTGGAL